MYSNYTLNGVPIKRPSTFKIERYKVSTLERIANADMCGDLIKRKLKFYFTYDAIQSTAFNIILGEIWEKDDMFGVLSYYENNVLKTATVYVGSIPSTLHRTGSIWVWKDVTFNLIEQ